MRTRRLALALALVGVARTAGAQDDPKQACVAAYTEGQRARKRAALKEAHDKLLVCARDPCPQVLRPECVEWLKDVEQRLPSIVLEARDGEGHDLAEVKVTIDAALATEKLDGHAIDLDPGEHVVRFEARGATATQKILLVEGEKRRRVAATLGVASPRPPPPPPERHPEPQRRVTWPMIGLGAAGALGLAGFTFFGLRGASKQSDLDQCRPECPPSRVDEVRRSYLVADISLAIGVVAIGTAIVLFATQPRASAPRTGGGP
jgi:hypothetical protein